MRRNEALSRVAEIVSPGQPAWAQAGEIEIMIRRVPNRSNRPAISVAEIWLDEARAWGRVPTTQRQLFEILK